MGIKKMTQLDVLHKIELNLLKTVVDICERHQINYFMIGGSLLGTIRHQGFIPWDDDIDVGFLRQDYEKFLQVAAGELQPAQRLMTTQNTKDYGFAFSKIVAENTEMVETYNLPNNAVHSVYVDLFPFDAIPAAVQARQKQYKQFKLYNRLVIERLKYGHADPPAKRAVIVALNLVHRFQSVGYLKQERRAIMTAYQAQAATLDQINMCSQYAYGKEIIKQSELHQFITRSFSGLQVKVPAAYDAILTRMYGDYMQLPPKDKQVEKHLSDFRVDGQIVD
ncbi:hypothetical protein AYR54_01970 [Loigolactobacillus backii]|uniref:LicD family protein n=2 Tax=Loigolactobacillus backii TaxID=375175 RepID=UPI0007F0C8AA|nr:LicD family protein [Loigolactobacillus backii]ANK59141.1 hypothetical protein AYR52_01980 [Loigolactobacillus backii]ANK64130.1 hypothetical protein AYR54_01970 [Loigolactobacillus backii]ANK67476.1 hypothetical protein AYR55_07070 [Loigolactobacillus backii]PIO88199.1 hypothetical protein B8A32_03790 [Loigolactobacillus backii]